ncbi:hypothetical protein Droror1_Dr00016519, partial [Drosera rotundifolia]
MCLTFSHWLLSHCLLTAFPSHNFSKPSMNFALSQFSNLSPRHTASAAGEPHPISRVSSMTWIVGKWMTPREQDLALTGTHFHQFAVPPISEFRNDCIYAGYAAMRLPEDVQGFGY